MNKKNRIIFLTGTRADFGKLRSLMDKIQKSKKFEMYIFVTGMHTLSKYGRTYEELLKRKYPNIFVYMNQTHTTDQDIILANTILGFGNFVKEIKPDMIIIHGDRVETLSGAIVGSFNNILVSHVEGGEVSGTIDEIIRHSVSKLSHLHFVANSEAEKRLIQMGESRNCIHVIGSPDIEVMRNNKLPSINEVKKHYEIPFKNYGVLIYHPIATEVNSLQNQISYIVKGVIESEKNYIVIYPNNDTGSNIILEEYKKFKNNEKFLIYPSIRFDYFLTLLKNSDFIIGNSSAGIREAEVYGIPSINIGTRQKNRSKNKNIINISPNKTKILNSIKKIQGKKLKPSSYFGMEQNTSSKFLKILKNNDTWKIPLQKYFIDLN